MPRPLEQAHSYVVNVNVATNKLTLTTSGWQPGYTAAHAETPEDALRHAIAKAEAEVITAKDRVRQAREMLSDYLFDTNYSYGPRES